MLTVHQIVNYPVPSNCFVLYDKSIGRNCIVVDPGSKSDTVLLEFMASEHLVPQYIVLTHEHFDHCWGVNELIEKFDIPIICSEQCVECIKYEKKNCSVFYDYKERFTIDSPTITIESLGFEIPFAEKNIIFFNTPGHTDASISFTINLNLFTGDTLLKDIKTVTKLPTGSLSKLKNTLQVYSSMQGQNYMVYPGHGDSFPLDGYEISKAVSASINPKA